MSALHCLAQFSSVSWATEQSTCTWCLNIRLMLMQTFDIMAACWPIVKTCFGYFWWKSKSPCSPHLMKQLPQRLRRQSHSHSGQVWQRKLCDDSKQTLPKSVLHVLQNFCLAYHSCCFFKFCVWCQCCGSSSVIVGLPQKTSLDMQWFHW